MRKSTKKRYWADPEYARLYNTAYRYGVSRGDLIGLFKRQPECQLCGTTEHKSVDHITPVSKGGTSEEKNLQTLCISCNAFKGDRLFLPEGGMML